MKAQKIANIFFANWQKLAKNIFIKYNKILLKYWQFYLFFANKLKVGKSYIANCQFYWQKIYFSNLNEVF